jgi:hypothetical protein
MPEPIDYASPPSRRHTPQSLITAKEKSKKFWKTLRLFSGIGTATCIGIMCLGSNSGNNMLLAVFGFLGGIICLTLFLIALIVCWWRYS